jgi:uncharacterized protein (TIGR02246 family)
MDKESQADVRVLESILRRLEAAENAGDASAIADMLAKDAVVMVPDYPVQEGKNACAAFVSSVLSSLLEEFDRRIAYVSAEVCVLGDWGFDRGSFSFTIAPRSGGETSRERGKYLFLYSRAADGSWKLARVIVNLDNRRAENVAR